jgi:hypothetical protein
MENCLVGSVDWQRRWVRGVVCDGTGLELARAVWPQDEAEDHVVAFLRRQREIHRLPVVVTGLSRAPWPNDMLESLWREGFAVELYEGAILSRLHKLERGCRENLAYRRAALLAALHLARRRDGTLGDLPSFVLQWSTQQARQRWSELALDMESSRPQRLDDPAPSLGPWERLRPSVSSELVRVSVLPVASSLALREWSK